MDAPPTIRRIEALDVVNLFRLIRRQGEFDLLHPSDEVSALSQVLDTVKNGFGLGAFNKAERLVATIGFAGIRSPKDGLRCELIWIACLPPYGTVCADFLDLATRAATLADIPVVVPKFSPDHPLIEAVKAAGFKAGAQYWRSKNKKKNAGRTRRVHGEPVQSG